MPDPALLTTDKPQHVAQLLTVGEVAGRLRIHPVTVRTYARDGVIPAYRVGRGWRFDPATVDAWLEARTSHPSVAALPAQLTVVDTAPAAPAPRRSRR